MNKELIKKYKDEFEHWLNGGKLQVKCVNGNWFEVQGDIFSCNMVNFVLVIDDEYVEYRKALAEGKTIQYYVDGFVGWQDVKSLNQSYIHPNSFRIKPEEPKFKIGDWVRDLRDNNVFQINSTNFNLKLSTKNTAYTHWEPKPEEWCWFWNDSIDAPILAKLISIDSVFGRPLEYKVKTTSCISETSYNYMSNMSFKKCEPFIGQLPSVLKD